MSCSFTNEDFFSIRKLLRYENKTLMCCYWKIIHSGGDSKSASHCAVTHHLIKDYLASLYLRLLFTFFQPRNKLL